MTPAPSPTESIASWPSPSSSPPQNNQTSIYNQLSEYQLGNENGIYRIDNDISSVASSSFAIHANGTIRNMESTQIIQKQFGSSHFIVSTDPKGGLVDRPHTFLNADPHGYDFQQLPPTPPATPPDYSNDELSSSTADKVLVADLNIVRKYHTQQTKTALDPTGESIPPKKYKCDKNLVSENNHKHSSSVACTPKVETNGNSDFMSNNHAPAHPCQDCSKIFKTKSNLNQHRNIVHHNIRHVCDKCGKSFTNSGYRYHKLTAHRAEETDDSQSDDSLKQTDIQIKKFECEKCGKRFAQNSLLRKHFSAVHEQTSDRFGGNRKFQCPYCPSQFKRKDHADRHITHLHSIAPDAKLFECNHPDCGKRFQSAGRLQQHSKLHQDNLTHPCPVCGKIILRKKNLSIHIITCHPNTSENLKCENNEVLDCKNESKTKLDVSKTNNNNAVNPSKTVCISSKTKIHKIPMKCLACEFTFIYPSKLAAHLSSYPDHCLIPSNYKKVSSSIKPIASHSESLEKNITNGSDDCGGVNEKDLMIIDDFINALLFNK